MPAKKSASSPAPRSSTQAAPRTRRKQSAPALDAAGTDVDAAALIDRDRVGRRDPPDRDRRPAAPDDAAGRSGGRRPEHVAGRRAGSVAARGLPLPGEDLPLRPRADPRARGARPRVRRARFLRALRVLGRAHPRRPVPASRRTNPGVRALLDRGRQQGLVRPRPRRPRLRREVLHEGGELGSRRQQHPGVLHPGRDQVPRPRPLREAGARSRVSRRRNRRTTTSGTSSR